MKKISISVVDSSRQRRTDILQKYTSYSQRFSVNRKFHGMQTPHTPPFAAYAVPLTRLFLLCRLCPRTIPCFTTHFITRKRRSAVGTRIHRKKKWTKKYDVTTIVHWNNKYTLYKVRSENITRGPSPFARHITALHIRCSVCVYIYKHYVI